jgi:hypothetical protein
MIAFLSKMKRPKVPAALASLSYERDVLKEELAGLRFTRSEGCPKDALAERRRLRSQLSVIELRLTELRAKVGVLFTVRPIRDAEGNVEIKNVTVEATGPLAQLVASRIAAGDLLVMEGERCGTRFKADSVSSFAPVPLPAVTAPASTGAGRRYRLSQQEGR